jgi:hypothetical protein
VAIIFSRKAGINALLRRRLQTRVLLYAGVMDMFFYIPLHFTRIMLTL